MKRTIKVGIIQQTCTNDIRHNLSKLHHNIEQVAAAGAQLVVLQELHNTPYFCQTEDTDMFDLAEPVPGPSTGFYSELAAGYGIVLVTSLFEKRAPGLYHNTAVVFDKDGSIAGKYRKMHIPDDPAYYEKFYFTPGDLGFEPIQTSLGKLGVQVCWDQWYPEGARLMALKGAEILIYPTAIGWESTDTQEEKIRQLGAWVTVQRGHAVANGLPVIAVNRVGHEPDPSGQTNGIQFWGNSFVAGPQGEILVQASNMDEENMVVELDMTRSENVRRWWPFLRDRRIDKFENLTRRFIVLFLAALLLVCFSGVTNAQTRKQREDAKREAWKKERQEKKALEAQQDSVSYVQAINALKNGSFVLEADNVVFRNGIMRFVSSNTNYVEVNDGQGIIQTAFTNFVYNWSPNGLGGVTVQGNVNGISMRQDKDGNVYYNYGINGIAVSATVSIVLTGGTNQASVTINPNFSGNTLTMNGYLVPYNESSVFQGTTW